MLDSGIKFEKEELDKIYEYYKGLISAKIKDGTIKVTATYSLTFDKCYNRLAEYLEDQFSNTSDFLVEAVVSEDSITLNITAL